MNRKDFLRVVAGGAAGAIASRSVRTDALSTQTPVSSTSRTMTNDALKGSTQAVVSFVTAARLDKFPADVVAQGKRCLLDGFAVILAGSTVKGSAIVRQYIRSVTDKQGATVLGPEKMMAPAAKAALANGASGHAMDFDDTQL